MSSLNDSVIDYFTLGYQLAADVDAEALDRQREELIQRLQALRKPDQSTPTVAESESPEKSGPGSG